MPLNSALIVLALLGADGPPPHADITADVRIIEMKGTAWRGQFHHRLQLVAQKQGTTVWTADKKTAAEIIQAAGSVTAAPRVTASPGAPAQFFDGRQRQCVTALYREADGPVNQATAVAFKPHVETLSDGCCVRIAGRVLDQGVLAHVAVENSKLLGLHEIKYAETLTPRPQSNRSETRINASYQVPEVATAAVAGEWLIPNDGALIISPGVHTIADGKGKAAVGEGVVVIEAKPAPAASSPMARFDEPARLDPRVSLARAMMAPPARIVAMPPVPLDMIFARSVLPPPPPAPPPIPVAGLISAEPAALGVASIPAHGPEARTMPQLPSRALPRSTTPDGSATPRPDDEAETTSFEDDSEEPRPSPQAKPFPPRDDSAVPTDVAERCCDTLEADALVVRLPMGPLTGEVRYQAGTPGRLSVGLRLGFVKVGNVVDEAVTRASAEAETPLAPKPAPAWRSARPVTIDLPVGDTTIHVEIRATKRPCAAPPR